MPHCDRCPSGSSLPTVKALMLHLEKVHNFTVLSKYMCGESGCNRKFPAKKSFCRHLKVDHGFSYSDISVSTLSNISTSSSGIVSSATQCSSESNEHEMIGEADAELSIPVESFSDFVMKQADAFVSKYYSKPGLPRNIVQSVIDDTKEFLSDGAAMNTLKSKVMSALQSSNVEESVIGDIETMFECIQNPFPHLSTEYFRMKHFTESGNYIEPVNFELGKRLMPMKTSMGVKYQWRPVYGVKIPLAPVLKKFLELPDAMQCILDYKKCLDEEIDSISNFIQCELWKQKIKRFQSTDIVLPLFVYFDDFESNNPLGPHCTKIGGVYVSIACLPPEIASKLENIFLATLFYTQDREEFTAKKILEPLIEELQSLENDGIEVKLSSGESVRVYFVFGLLLGDNLGVHQLCGFVCSFSWANFPCRFCKIPQDRMQYDLRLDKSLLRDKHNYEQDLTIKDQTKTGIRENCALNSIESYHITENFEGDILHDFDEGICHNVMVFVLSKLTKPESKTKPPIIKLSTLNRRLQLFDFGTHSSLFKTRAFISTEMLDKGKLKMTGSEMQCFVRNFGLLVGDLVPEGNVYWKLYLCLVRVLDIVVAKTVPKTCAESLKYYVYELGKEFMSHDENHLTFKFHKILWHYCSIFEKSGPVGNLSTRRYESKHRELKQGLSANMSRVHACWSAAVKHQLALCHRFVANESVLPDVMFGSGDYLEPDKMVNFHEHEIALQAIFPDLKSVFMPTWVDYKGSHYDNNSTVIIDFDEDLGLPIFGELEVIFVWSRSVALLCRKLKTIDFNEHFHAYEVKKTREKVSLNIESLVDPFPLNTLRSPKGGKFVILRCLL